MRHALIVVLASLVGLAASAQDAGVSRDGGVSDASGTPANPLAGTWKLDREASSDLTPVLAHFEASFVTRKVANSVAPTNVITWKGDRFELAVKAMVTRVSTVVLDGVTPTSDELFGNPYTFTSTLVGQAVVSHGHVARSAGVKEPLELRRAVEPDGRMQLRIIIAPDGGAPLEIRRVFNRVAP